MKTLCLIICGIDKPSKYVTPIKRYETISDENKKYFLGSDPVLYEENDGSIHTCQKSQIVYIDLKNSFKNVGNYYKVENAYIEPAI